LRRVIPSGKLEKEFRKGEKLLNKGTVSFSEERDEEEWFECSSMTGIAFSSQKILKIANFFYQQVTLLSLKTGNEEEEEEEEEEWWSICEKYVCEIDLFV
jgi:hypothetical protein